MAGRSPVGTRLGWVLVGASIVAFVAAALLAEAERDEPATSSRSPAEVRRAAVLVDAFGCPVDSQGMGVAVASDLIVTNAHVVAGSESVEVTAADGGVGTASLVGFDPLRDLALLEVDLDVAVLTVAPPQGGSAASVLAIRSTEDRERDFVETIEGTVVRTIDIFISDIYGDGRYERHGFELAIDVKPGDSGAGVIDDVGNLIGVVFSSSRGQDGVSYAVSALEVEDLVAGRSSIPVDAGVCRP